MKHGDTSHRRQSDWSSHERGAASPKGLSARRSEGGSREELSKMARGGEPSWRSGANTTPLAKSDSIKWGEPSRSGRGEPSSSGWMESISIPSGASEAASNPSNGDIESKKNNWRGNPSPGWGKPSVSTAWGAAPTPPSHPAPDVPPSPTSPRIRRPEASHPPTSPHTRRPAAEASHPPASPRVRHPAVEEFRPSTSSHTKPEEAARSLPESEKASKSDVRTSRDRRQHSWSRLTLLAEAVMLRTEYMQITRTLEARRKMQNTIRYTHVSENVQSKLNGFAQECEDKGKDLKAKLDDILTKLVDADTLMNGPDEEALSRDQESLRDYQSRFDQLEAMVQKLSLEVNRWSSQPREQDDGHPLIGQKRSQDLALERVADCNPDLVKRLERLEAHMSDIDNQSVQQMETVIEVVDTRVDLKLSELPVEGSVPEDGELVDTSMERPHAEPGISPVKTSLQEQVAKLTRDHDVFVDETANLITMQAETAADMRRLQDENIALKEALSGCQSALRSLQEMSDHNNRRIQALTETVKVISAQSSQPLSQLDILSLDQLQDRVKNDILPSVNTSLVAFREESEATWRMAREETLKQIAAKLGPTMDLVNIIHGYFSRTWEKEEGPPST